MSIYEFGYTNYVQPNKKELIGKTVKVVKGRKYPIGSEHIIKGFTTWNDQYGHSTDYIITTNNVKINVLNVRLVKSDVWYKPIIRWMSLEKKQCPNCNSNKLKYCYTYYHSSIDYYVDRYECLECGLDIEKY